MAAGLKIGQGMMDKLVEEVKVAIGAECTVNVREVEKNNGTVLQGIEIWEPGVCARPVIYSDRILKMIKSGEISLQEAAGRIADTYRKSLNMQGVQDVVSGLSKEYILGRVVYQMVNAEKNAGRLEKAPHMKFLDLAAIYRVVVGDGSGSIMVNWSLCDKLAITEDELDAAARRNTEKSSFQCAASLGGFE